MDFKEQILQLARDKAYASFASGDWTSASTINEILVVPLGEGCRSEQYFARLTDYIGQEFCCIGATCNRIIDGKKNVACSFIGLLASSLNAAFCSIHILSALRILYGRDREMKRGYVMGLRTSGFGKHDKNKEVLALVNQTAFWFGVYTGARRANIPKGDSYKQGFAQGVKDGNDGVYNNGPKKINNLS